MDGDKILHFAAKHEKVATSDVVAMFGISRQAAHKKLSTLRKKGKLSKIGKTRFSFYVLPEKLLDHQVIRGISFTIQNKNVQEQQVLDRVLAGFPFLLQLSEHVRSIFNYTFLEMLNNAIEHSLSDKIGIKVEVHDEMLSFEIRDFGIGVFQNVMKKFNLSSEFEAMQELTKGKTTTQPQLHSGEGIFFTSKIADRFELNSFGFQFLTDNTIPDTFFQEAQTPLKGTRVSFTLSTKTKKHLIDLFAEFQNGDDDVGFVKTKIQVKLFTYGTIHVSRSQARRILNNLEKFKLIVLDFDHVPTVGQAFVDEVFRVFQNKYPAIQIQVINANHAVRFMIERVRKFD